MGPGLAGPGYRYSTPPAHPSYHHPGYTPPTTVIAVHGPGMQSREVKVVVGLISVEQLSLSALISGFWGITEVYNLLRIGNPNDHKLIPGID